MEFKLLSSEPEEGKKNYEKKGKKGRLVKHTLLHFMFILTVLVVSCKNTLVPLG